MHDLIAFLTVLFGNGCSERRGHWTVVILSGAKIFLFLFGHGSNMKFCKWQDEKWHNWIKNWTISPLFHNVCWHLGGQRGGRHWSVNILPGGWDISVGRFGHRGNKEISKQRAKKWHNCIKWWHKKMNDLTVFFHSLFVWWLPEERRGNLLRWERRRCIRC